MSKQRILSEIGSDVVSEEKLAKKPRYTEEMRKEYVETGKSLLKSLVDGFNRNDKEKYYFDQLKHWDILSRAEKNVLTTAWKKKSKAKTGNNRMKNIVFLQSTAKEMSNYFNEDCHLELPELEFYLDFSIKNENTKETALLLDYKNKTFEKEYLEQRENRKELIGLGFETPTLAELCEMWNVKTVIGEKSGEEFLIIGGYRGSDKIELLPQCSKEGYRIRMIQKNNGNFSTLEIISLPEGLEVIGFQTFYKSALKEINIPSTVKVIGHKAFSETQLIEIIVPESINTILNGLFENCYFLEKVILPDSVTEICEDSFLGCTSLIEINLPNALTRIGDKAFSGCSLKEIHIPNTVTSIGAKAFAECHCLENVTLSNELDNLSDDIFHSCNNLKKVILSTHIPKISKNMFRDCPALEFIGVDGGENLLDSLIY